MSRTVAMLGAHNTVGPAIDDGPGEQIERCPPEAWMIPYECRKQGCGNIANHERCLVDMKAAQES